MININVSKSSSINTNQIPLSGNRLKLHPWSLPTRIKSALLSIANGLTSRLSSFYCISNHNLDNVQKIWLKLHEHWRSYWKNKLWLTNRKKLPSAEKYGCKKNRKLRHFFAMTTPMNTGNNKFLSFSEKALVIVFLYLCYWTCRDSTQNFGRWWPGKIYSPVIRAVSSYLPRNLHIRH